ncbi:TA system VapC family ribonuclease toxin [Terriglobus saanensis]|uniref:Ribonuclease VapC n=1 Tax=Terriglobus saanensis (strain ATCC BAA-1853 / DSM 23119 / SP1PR4) TaxID=401053 RepID=E8UYA3_TERSS|nr:TA system VapC family ribonuclease toxin [Terriglobus saanensis]ADV80913.1 PIN domain protein family protein [Terriglobus saanensis SP1PR4]
MILLDANLLIYAYDEAAPHHKRSSKWIERIFSSREPVLIPVAAIMAFLRIMTHQALPGPRFSMEEGIGIVDEWFSLSHVSIAITGNEHWNYLRQTLTDGQARSSLVTDSHLAALAIENGATLCSVDRDFARFPGLRWVDPLTETS